MSIAALESEQAVIGAALDNPESCDIALERVREDMFFEPAHAAVWNRIAHQRRSGSVADASIIAGQLDKNPGLSALGGLPYLLDMVEKAPLWALDAHIEVLTDRATRRGVQALSREIAAKCEHVMEGSGDLILAELERGAADIARQSGSASLAIPAGPA